MDNDSEGRLLVCDGACAPLFGDGLRLGMGTGLELAPALRYILSALVPKKFFQANKKCFHGNGNDYCPRHLGLAEDGTSVRKTTL